MNQQEMNEWYYQVNEDCVWYIQSFQVKEWRVADQLALLPPECDNSVLLVEQNKLQEETRAYATLLEMATTECDAMNLVLNRHQEACRLERPGDISFAHERSVERKEAWTKFMVVRNGVSHTMGYTSGPV